MVRKIKLDDGTIRDCKYDNAEIMFAETEAKGIKVIEYWIVI